MNLVNNRIVLTLALVWMSALTSSAKLEQKMVPIDASQKQATMTLSHFTKKNVVAVVPTNTNIGATIKPKATAGVSISASSGVSTKNNALVISAKADYLIKNSKIVKTSSPARNQKHTFLLISNTGDYAIGYSPSMTIEKLQYAIAQYINASKHGFKSAVLLASGHQCGFYQSNGAYHPYYLRELRPSKRVLTIR